VSYPDKIDVSYSYTGFASGLGDGSFPGAQVDADLAGIEASANALNDFVRAVVRADKRLANGLVTPDTLSSEARAAFNSTFAPKGEWASSTAYAVGDVVSTTSGTKAYVCLVAHTSSGVFATDLAAGKWLLWAVDGNTASAIAATPVGGLAATDVQAALAELDTEKQAANAILAAIAALSPAVDKVPYFTGASAVALADFTAFARTLLAGASASAMRTTLGLGAMALRATVATSDIDALAVTTAKINDAAVTTVKIADGAVTAAKLGAGAVVQVVGTTSGAVATGTTTVPLDDTIPQNTEGTEFLTQAVTPVSATDVLEIEVLLNATGSTAGGTIIVALFQDATANALCAAAMRFAAAGDNQQVKLLHRMTAGGTAATTFKVRAGLAAAGTVTVNGSAGTRQFGGVKLSSITIREVKV
jgi:hypothetical protein